jgi:hypothetical protein
MSASAQVRWVTASSDPRTASVRIRVLAVIAELAARGVDAGVFREGEPLDDSALVVFCKTYRPYDLDLARRLRGAGVTVAFDLCDNHFLLPEPHRERLVGMMQLADLWVFSTEVLRDIAQSHLGVSRPSAVIPDAVDLRMEQWVRGAWRRVTEAIPQRLWRRAAGIERHSRDLRLIWFGNHAGSFGDAGLRHLAALRPLLESLAGTFPIALTVVSNSYPTYRSVTAGWKLRTQYVPWSLLTFVDVLRMHAIAVIPISVNEFTVAKSNNRAALALAHGVAVVADGIPSYEEFRDCAFIDDWGGIERYLRDVRLREAHVDIGRNRVVRRYSAAHVADDWQAFLARA